MTSDVADVICPHYAGLAGEPGAEAMPSGGELHGQTVGGEWAEFVGVL